MKTRPIDINDYTQGRCKAYALEWTETHEKNAKDLLTRVNTLLKQYGFYPVVTSGWRPSEINKKVGGSKGSKHIMCQAVDLADSYKELGGWLLKNTHLLKQCGLYMEDPMYTPTWVHLQSVAPKSGLPVFLP